MTALPAATLASLQTFRAWSASHWMVIAVAFALAAGLSLLRRKWLHE